MNKRIQTIEAPSGEKLVVLPESEYLMLLVAAEEDDELLPDFAEELDRRREAIADGAATKPFDEIRKR